MFNHMKNQVREKTGKELPKFTPQKGGLSRQSRQGSESSINSLVPDPLPESSIRLPDGKVLSCKEITFLLKREEELRLKLDKKDSEWSSILEKKEKEHTEELQKCAEDWKLKDVTVKEDLLKQASQLKEAIVTIEDYKRKICQYQEDKDQLEGFQTQEMSKIKHLLLATEKENTEIAQSLKENLALVESLKTEVGRLRPFEEQVSNFQLYSFINPPQSHQDDIEVLRHTSEKERWQLCSKLAQSEEQVRHLTDRVAVLTRRSESDIGDIGLDDRVTALLGERALLERRLEEAHVHLQDIKTSWSAQIASLETQVERLSRQAGEEGSERRRAEGKITELEVRLEEDTKEKTKLVSKMERLTAERDTLAFEIKTLTASSEETKAELTSMKNKLRTTLESEKSLEDKVQEMTSELQSLKEKYNLTVQDLASATTELQEERDQRELEVNQQNTKIEGLEADISRERKEKDDALIRSAQFSQQVDIVKQELDQHQQESEEIYKKVSSFEKSVKEKEEEISKLEEKITELNALVITLQSDSVPKDVATKTETSLKDTISDLEAQIAEKNKSIRVLQQKLGDMKKTLQKELKASESSEAVPNHHNSSGVPKEKQKNSEDDVNFQYLKHVIIKFLTSREYEAQHLTKAVATLLKLSPEEESLLKDTLEWRMSWFKSRPKLHNNHPHS